MPQWYLDTYGREKVAEVVGVKKAMISMWLTRKAFPTSALDKLLAFDSSPMGQVEPLYKAPELASKLAILMPSTGSPTSPTFECLMRLFDRKEMDYKRVSFNNLSVARNSLAAWWLASPCEWAFWADADMVFPCGDAKWFKDTCDLPNMPDMYAGVHTIYRMLVHKKSFVSVSYVGRRRGAPAQFSGGDSASMRQSLKRGPRNELMECDWCGFGGVLMNRKVLEDIIAQQGKEIKTNSPFLKARFGYEYSFFSPTRMDTPGDDIPFCERATRAGHKPHIDLSIFAGHVGEKVFNYDSL